MKFIHFSSWCYIATSQIRYVPDRQAVSDELLAHLEDHQQALMAQGMSEEDAAKAALECMGSATELAPQLAAVHQPFWAYCLSVTRVLMLLLLGVVLICFWNFLSDQRIGLTNYPQTYLADAGYVWVGSGESADSFTDSGYTYSLTNAELWQSQTNLALYFNVRQTGWLPCSTTRDYSWYDYSMQYFWAEDDLGNYYYSYAECLEDDLCLQVTRSQSSFISWTYECWINSFPEDAQWIDLHYDRDGRDHVLRIHLTGGDGT